MCKLPRYLFWLVLFFCWPSILFAEPMFEAKNGNVRIVLYDEPCAIEEVSNLPRRVVWTENGKDVEGCWGANPSLGIVSTYFKADRTVATIPMKAFQRVTGV